MQLNGSSILIRLLLLLPEIKLNKADKEKKRSKSLVKKKRKKEKETEVHLDAVDELSNRDSGGSSEKLKCWYLSSSVFAHFKASK